MSEIRVDFRGQVAGVGELTWGQLGIWRRTQDTGRTMNLVVTMPLPQGTPLGEMAAVLRFIVSRNPALRTLLRFVEGPGGLRHPQQVVFDAGQVPLQILDIDDGDDAAEVAEQLRSRYELTWFDYENEFPVRMGVVRRSGALAYLVVGYSHVMIDGVGLAALGRDLVHLDRATGEATAPAHALDPLEVARVQGGPAGRRQSDKCVRYWAAQLERLPAWRIDRPADPPQPRFWELVAYSPAMELGLRAIAERSKVTSNYVLIAAYAVAVARVMGRNPNVVQIVVDNRFRPGFADAVGQLSEPGICVVDVADATFDEVVGRAWRAATSASLHAYYDTRERDRLLEETEARQDRPLDISWHLNDRRGLLAPRADESSLTQAQLKTAIQEVLPRTKLYWDRKRPAFDGTLFIQADSSPEPAIVSRKALEEEGLPAVYLEVWTDMHHFTPAQIEAFVREMEAIVVEAALDAAVPTGVRPPAAAV